MFQNKFFIVGGLSTLLFAIYLTQVSSFPEYEVEFDETLDSDDVVSTNENFQKRPLNAEETELANQARNEIANIIEKNLIRLFAVIALQDRIARQEEDGGDYDGGDLAAAANPNVLPQVAQILGAIFSGSLNLTSVVDRAVNFVPNALRNQLDGVFKLLTGNSRFGTTTPASAAAAAAGAASQTGAEVTVKRRRQRTTTPVPNVEETKPQPQASSAPVAPAPPQPPPPPPASQESQGDITDGKTLPPKLCSGKVCSSPYKKTKPGIQVSNSKSGKQPDGILRDVVPVTEDEILEVERKIVEDAIAYEPYVSTKEPRYFFTQMRDIISRVDFNMTEVIRTVPSIFKGAREAFGLLENLGQIATGDADEDDYD